MEKEEKFAFEYGRAAAESGCPFAVCDDPRMYKLLKGTSGKPGIQIDSENLRAWYMGYLTQTALAGNGISQELFAAGLRVLFDSEPECVSNWIGFAAECVDLGQYVDFVESEDHAVVVGHWLETLLASLFETQRQYGANLAKQVCDLALIPNCLYPSEMIKAAEHFRNGGAPENISKMIESGAIEGEQPFFPKLANAAGENNSHNPNAGMEWTILGR